MGFILAQLPRWYGKQTFIHVSFNFGFCSVLVITFLFSHDSLVFLFYIIHYEFPYRYHALVVYSNPFSLFSGSDTVLFHLSNSVFMSPNCWCKVVQS